MTNTKWRPSPALVLSILALILALGGSAVAAGGLSKKKVNKLITKRAPGLNVATAKTADRATNATSADTAKTADAVSGIPLANLAVGRSDPTTGGQCDPQNNTFVVCADVDLTLPHAGRVLLIGTAGQYAFAPGVSRGDCRMTVDGNSVGASQVSVGNQSDPAAGVTGNANRGFANGFTTTVVTDSLPAGAHNFALACNELDADVEFESPQISAALFGSG